MINIKIRKSLLKMLLRKHLLQFQTSNDKLSQIDITRTIRIDHPHQKTHSVLRNTRLSLQSRLKLNLTNHTIMIAIQLLKYLYKKRFLFSRQQLRHNKCVHNSLQFIFKLYRSKNTLKLPIL